ncbi:transcription antitermination factor NusB [Candidatus Berkelbacteria bacterium CG_4_9_14_3_um_filter_39_23]|uniref:Transcription antitermination protein NusB n=2 Tax=Candidatus Berkelbacteria TaxID=1618330 RepID=A0A2M7CIK0_9BACT|nr:MAG: transcription antitermination factor NusB [Candidatus Berkelbacteria bacterium CG2_30_39_44]PIR28125.1 MAG: transcription antitermination factor NusB [Candidatus Berkelbacteria bacterium CG11_big_fil_rev_8_21_14_0_20_40_23]PIV25466.1 MAG: transcription antitermination factor NusB [Candidatus Berkelbacteria bacterium CG03_land_8_20_14_0_80_40_36]PIX30413.1 MAG: transcription antitermination factor NusB [Candidatus Berkelbacteria bacterium CG_4_8_14_3_um_filter_39_27]PIZ28921.1 MAG: trans
MNRHLSRTLAMQIVYEWDFIGKKNLDEIKNRSYEIFARDLDNEYADKIIDGVTKNVDTLDKKIIEVAPDWPIEQVANINKAILRVSIFELENFADIPPKVIINEAVELAKSFGGSNSFKFVNGVLGTIYRKSNRFEKDEEINQINEKPIAEIKE